jgi:hypothetical protein
VNSQKNSQKKKIHHGEMVQGMILKWIPQIFEAKLVQVGACSSKLDILVPTCRYFSTSKFEQICWYYCIPQMFEAKLAQASGIPGCYVRLVLKYLNFGTKYLLTIVLQDEADNDETRQTAMTMSEFIEGYFPRKYGLPKLAAKAEAELYNGIKKHMHTHRRIQLFAVCCGIGCEDDEFSFAFSQFLLKSISRVIAPVDLITEKMSQKECEIDIETINAAIEYLFKDDMEPVTPVFTPFSSFTGTKVLIYWYQITYYARNRVLSHR